MLNNFRKSISQRFKRVNFRKPAQFIQKRPILSFILALLILLGLIAASNFLLKAPSTDIPKSEQAKVASVYKIGEAPRISMQAVVEKSGVIKITALSGGVVQAINVTEGQDVARGTNLVSLSSNYQGGNSMSVSRSIAAATYQNTKDTYDSQQDLINKQKDLANKVDENSDQLSDIGHQSVNETLAIVGLNEEVLNSLVSGQATLEASNSGGVNDSQIQQIKGLRSQLMSANNQLRQSVRNSDYSVDSNKPPRQLSDMQKDITLKQLDIQSKALALNLEVSKLSLAMAQINEAIMFPSAPFAGRVERIHVKVGEAVSPGAVLITLSGNSEKLQAVTFVTAQTAKNISLTEESTVHIDNKVFTTLPSYVSTEATDNNLYSAIFSIPDEFAKEISDKSYITIDIPVGVPDTGSAIPFVPVDSIFQTQDKAYLLVLENNQAVSREVKLGEVTGRFVEIQDGLRSGDQVILNRNIVAGEKATAN